jgi:cytochrome o ubiquinol oxidase subunit II
MDMKTRASVVLLALVLLATGFTAQAQTTYGPIRPGDDLWEIARRVYPDQGVTTDQVMLALLRANPQAFEYPCNANAPLHSGVVLQVPALAEVKVLSREDAQREFGRQLREWKDHRLTGKPFVCPPVGEVAPASSHVGAATPPQAATAVPAERPQGDAPTAPSTPVAVSPPPAAAAVPAERHPQREAPTTPATPVAVPPEQPQAEVPAALPTTAPVPGEQSQAAAIAPTTQVGATTAPSGLVVLDPRGPIGEAERTVIFEAVGLMLIVVVPVILLSLWIPRHYRAGNTKAKYDPGWTHSNALEAVVWLVPALIVAALGALVWVSTHRLDPYKPIASTVPPVEVQAISMDWKWLFIYPQFGIATVNQLVFPANTPLSLRITSDSVMTAFFVPQLGSQIYAMAGMETRLNLQADAPGSYLGENSQYSGKGFSQMHFEVRATSREDFDRWVDKVRRSPETLDSDRLVRLERPSTAAPVEHFSQVTANLFETIVGKYSSMPGDSTTPMPGGADRSVPGEGKPPKSGAPSLSG